MVEYVVYYRVSTERQGRSGLGLDAQRLMVEQFLTSQDTVLSEFTDIESGRKDNRTELQKALKLVKAHRAKLLIPKLDRFSRKVSFISGIIDQGIELAVCEHPNVSTFFLHLLACFAEEERRQISERTKAALAIAKQRGVPLGQNGRLLAMRRREERAARSKLLEQEFTDAWRAQGTYSGVARALNRAGVPTPQNKCWYPQTVKNYVLALGLF
ncbi:recombinase family protein [Rhodobacterales bacterium LSUCC1028]|nr:recombinase family protein [Rhodobacterales bacterium LSUCC1028]